METTRWMVPPTPHGRAMTQVSLLNGQKIKQQQALLACPVNGASFCPHQMARHFPDLGKWLQLLLPLAQRSLLHGC